MYLETVMIMESLFKLKQSEQKFRQIVIADKPTRWQSTRWQDTSLTNQLADIRCIGLRKHWHGE